MRILRVAQKCYPDVTGGGPYHVHAMSRDQAAMGHDVTVLTVRASPDLPHLEHRAGYTIVRYDPAVTLFGNAISPGLARFLATNSFDVVHAHSHLYASTNIAALTRWATACAVRCRELLRNEQDRRHTQTEKSRRHTQTERGQRPLAVTNHGLYSQTAPEWLFEWYLRTLGRWTFDQADVVFCYTDADERRLRERGVSAPIAVVPNGIDTARFARDGPESPLLADGEPTLLFAGRLVEGKRPADAIRAVQQLCKQYPTARLYLCGDGPLRCELDALAGEETVFLGELSYDQMPGVYRAADVLVLPSRAEGTPRSVLEALACGTPAVCADLPNLRAAFGDAARYFDPGRVSSLATSLDALLSERGETGLPTGTAATVVTDWHETVRQTTERLETLVESGGDRRS